MATKKGSNKNKGKNTTPATAAEETATTAKNSETPKGAKKEEALDNINKDAIEEKLSNKKDLKYVYPADVTSPEDKKKFRAKARRKLRKMHKDLQALKESKERGSVTQAKELEKELKEVVDLIITPEHQPEVLKTA